MKSINQAKFVLLSILLVILVGCNTTQGITYNSRPSADDAQRVMYKGLNNKTARIIRKYDLAQYVCEIEAKLYNEQRLIYQAGAPIIINNGVVVDTSNVK